MESSSNVSPSSVYVPSVPAADPAWPLVVLDALHPVVDDTPLVLDNTLLALDGTLPGIVLPAAGALPPAAGALPPAAGGRDDHLPLVTPVLDDHRPGIERAVQ